MVLSQNFKFIQRESNTLFLNIIVFLGFLLNKKSKDPKWNFYNFANSCILLLAQNTEHQSARDLAESIYLQSINENMINAGLYVQSSIFIYQKKINDSLFYILGFLKTIDSDTPRGVVISSLVSIQKIFRDHHMIEFETIIFDFLLSNYSSYFNVKMYLQIRLIHFAAKLMKKIDITYELELFLNTEREKIFSDGIESLVICYSILKSTLKIFESSVLKNYLELFDKMIPQNLLEGINTQFGETDDIPGQYNIIFSRLAKTRYHEDMVSEVRNHIPFFHSMIKNSYMELDLRKFTNAFLFLSDLSLEQDEKILEENMQKIVYEEHSENDYYENNFNKFLESYSKNETTLFWVGVENSIYLMKAITDDIKINQLKLTIDDYYSVLKSLYSIVNFKGEQELDFDQNEILKDQLSKLSQLSIQTDVQNSICIVTDNSMSSLPFNLLQKEDKFIFLSNPLFSIPSNNFQQNVQRVLINNKISFWSPIDTGDIVLNKAYNSIEKTLKKFNSVISTSINIERTLNADIDIIIAHGGKSIDTKNTISAESSFSQNPQMYTYSNIDDVVENPKIILFFVCHSGKISKDYFFEKQNSILKKFFNKGTQVIIAPKWPLNIDILPIWLEVFLKSLSSGNSSLISFHLASKEVYCKYKNIGAWGCLHYFGNKDVYISST